MPESARHKRRHAGTESGLLAPRRDPQVDVVAQPVVGIHVPPSQVRSRVLGRLDAPRVDVLESVPRNFTGDGVDAVVAQAGQDAGAFSQRPYAVKLEAGHHAGHVDVPYALQKRSLGECGGGDERRAVSAGEGNKQTDPYQPSYSLDGGGRAAARNLALLTHGGLLRGIDLGGDIEHGRIDPSVVLGVIKGRASKQRREEEHICGVVDERGKLFQCATLLELGQLVGRQLAVGDVPAKGRELHDEDHLRAGDVDCGRVVGDLAIDVADGHVAHDEDEADPGHVGAAAEVFGDGVGAARADEKRDDAIPQIEQADEIEEGDALFRAKVGKESAETRTRRTWQSRGGLLLWRNLQDDEDVLLQGLRVGQALEDSGQRIRKQEREGQLDY